LFDGGLADTILLRPLARADFTRVLTTLAEGGRLTAASAQDTTAAEVLPNFPGRHVLVVDDNAVNREIAIEALGRFDISATVAEDGQAAVEMLRSRRFDLVLMDGSMPRMDGFEATRTIRREEAEGAKVRSTIVALTADVVGTRASDWKAAGADEILHKPFTIKGLAET